MKEIVERLVDDLTGVSITDGDGESMSFAVDGVSYEIDLSMANSATFRAALRPYIAAARPVQERSRNRTADARRRAREIRDWAARNGISVGERGRLPLSAIAAWNTRDDAD